MRLDQFLSARTMYSRRELRQMIQKGKATVDGAVVRKADQHVQPDENTVCLNGTHPRRPVSLCAAAQAQGLCQLCG